MGNKRLSLQKQRRWRTKAKGADRCMNAHVHSYLDLCEDKRKKVESMALNTDGNR